MERDVHHSLQEYSRRTGEKISSVVATAVAVYLDQADQTKERTGVA